MPKQVSRKRVKLPSQLKITPASLGNTAESMETESKATESNADKSRRNKFFNMKSLMSPKGKEQFGFRFKQNKTESAIETDSTSQVEEEEPAAPMPSVNQSPQRKRAVMTDGGLIPQHTPSKAIKTLGLNDGSRKASRAERVLGAQHIHDPSSKKPDYHLQGSNRKNDASAMTQQRHPYDEPSPATDEGESSKDSGEDSQKEERDRAYHELCQQQNQGFSTTPGFLSRSKSLRYIDNENPPTPPEKDTLKVARHTGSEMLNSASLGGPPGFIKMFDHQGRTERPVTNILSIGANQSQHQNASLVHQDSIYSMRGSVEVEENENGKHHGHEPPIPQRVSSLPEEHVTSHSASLHKSHESDYTQLQPAFYTPSMYSCSSQDTRPSRNVSYLLLPSNTKSVRLENTTTHLISHLLMYLLAQFTGLLHSLSPFNEKALRSKSISYFKICTQ